MFGGPNDRNARNPLKPGFLALLVMLTAAFVFAGCGAPAPTVESADSAPDTSTVAPVVTPNEVDTTSDTDTPNNELMTNEPTEPNETVQLVQPVEPVEPVEPVSFANDFSQSVQPILAEKCATCHGVGGPGSPHWVLGTAQDAVDTHLLISGVISSGYMPPWPATDLSVDFHQNRSLRDDQIQAILDWSIAGAPLDIGADAEIPAIAGLNRLADPDVVISPAEPYAGDGSRTDDLRCQIYDPQMPDGGLITGYEFVPDQTEVVHHAVGFPVPADQMEHLYALDGADGRPGWACADMSGLPPVLPLIVWAPGQDATAFPQGSAFELTPGASIVVQIHYHYEGSAPLDASALALKFASDQDVADAGGRLDRIVTGQGFAPVEIPCASWEQGPMCDRDASIEEARARLGDSGVITDFVNARCGHSHEDFARFTEGVAYSECTVPAMAFGSTGELVSVLGHMHEIGDWFRVTLNPGTPGESILLDIDDWAFDWQYNYDLAEPVKIGPRDRVKIECGWDRARSGADVEPAYIVWADGTHDEMCVAFLTFRQ